MKPLPSVAILTVLLLSLAAVVVAQEGGLLVHAPSGASIEVSGGSTVQRAVSVENTTQQAAMVEVKVATVDGVRLLGPLEAKQIAAGSWDVFPLVFQVSDTATAHRHPVIYAVYATLADGRRSLVADGTLYLDVASASRLDARLSGAPSVVVGENPFSVQLALRNAGNTPLDLRIDYHSSGTSSLVDPTMIDAPVTLAAGESRAMDLVFAAADPQRASVDRIEVRVTDVARGVAGRVATVVEIVPPTLSPRAAMLDYPIRLETTIAGSNEDDRAVVSGSVGVVGASTVGTGDERTLEFDLRKAGVLVPVALSEHPDDRFQVRYAGPTVEIDLGDRSRSVSGLVQPAERTRGAELQLSQGRVSAGVLVQQATRDEQPVDMLTASAAIAGPQVSDGLGYSATLSGTAVAGSDATNDATNDARPFAQDLTLSLDQAFIGAHGLSLSGEIATSIGASSLLEGSAARLVGALDRPGYSGSFSGQAVGPEFESRLPDGYSFGLRTAFRPWATALELAVSSDIGYRPPGEDYADDSSPFRRENVVSAAYRLEGLLLELGLSGGTEGVAFLGQADSVTRGVELEAALAGPTLALAAGGSLTAQTTYPGASQRFDSEATASVGFAADRSALSIAARHQRTDLASATGAQRLDLSASAEHSLDRVDLSADATWYVPLGDAGRPQLSFSLDSALPLGNASLITASLGWAQELAQDRAPDWWNAIEFELTYATRLSVPYARRPELGAVEGIFVDTVENSPVIGAVVRLADQATITDERGRFSFPAVPVGRYRLIPDTATLPPGRLVEQASSAVVVESRGTTQADLQLVAGHSLTGTLATATPTAAAILEGGTSSDWRESVSLGRARLTPISGTRVMIEKEGLVLTTHTDEAGAFLFSSLEPGAWSLTLPAAADGAPYNVFAVASSGDETVPVETAPGVFAVRLADSDSVAIEAARVIDRSAPTMLEGAPLSVTGAPGK